MKKDIIEFFRKSIGVKTSEHIGGFGGWLNGKLKEISEDGDVNIEFEVREEFLNPLGTIHGGAIAAIMDEIMGMQLFLKSNKEDSYFALNISVDFVKNAKLGEKLCAKPEVIRIGRKTAVLRCTLTNEAGQVIAISSSNFLKLGE